MACLIHHVSVHSQRYLRSCQLSTFDLPLNRVPVPPKRHVGGLRGVNHIHCSSYGTYVASAAASDQSGLNVEQLLTLQTNIDDCSPQTLAFAAEQLLAAGALDVWMVNAVMKKGRAGVVLNVLCDSSLCNAMMSIIFCETTSLGVRVSPCDRVSLQRVVESALTPFGWVPVKAAYLQGKLVTVTAEFDNCAELARQSNVPIKVVKEAAEVWFKQNEGQQ